MAFEAVVDDKRVRAFIAQISTRLKHIKGGQREYMGLIGAVVWKDVIAHFQDEKGPSGKWKPWSKIYAEHMARSGKSGNKLLQDSGRLRGNFRPTDNRSTTSGIIWFNNAKTSDGFNYAAAHNEGTGKLPERRFMWLSPKALGDISKQTLAYVLDKGF